MHRGLLLVAALFAALLAATSAAAKTGGTFVAELSTDVDYVDPGLDYLSSGWEIQYATGCKLLNYPDTNGARGGQLVPEVAAGFPKVSQNGKTCQAGLQVRRRHSGHRPELRRRLQPR